MLRGGKMSSQRVVERIYVSSGSDRSSLIVKDDPFDDCSELYTKQYLDKAVKGSWGEGLMMGLLIAALAALVTR